ncbi:enoyl-CoA hydratase/isomerase family protein [uncultured Jatrophihabitans sp.]|uniref:enoyl-CoA hydratase/isomerase family protein n=1 Tax=uncultured Jatrophihabitans sp. TaxID=1610747 RepID=UPI0035CACF5E
MAEHTTLSIEYRERVAVLTLDRPDDANSLNPTMARELADVAAALDRDEQVRAVVLTGAGRFFCAGGDVKAMLEFPNMAVGLKSLADDLHRGISTLNRMPAPLIVAVNGTAAGAGFSLVTGGDLVVAAESAKFTMAYSKIGLSPDGSSSYFLPRVVGLRRAQELMFTNRVLTANEAFDWGLVTRVVADGTVLDEALTLATLLAAGSRGSHAAIKQLLTASFDNSLETQMELEGRLIADRAASPDGQEGTRAFAAKRAPAFD